jgi:hypothetical protein
MHSNSVRIIGVPSGEAPIEIRKEWVGLVLPLMPGRDDPYQLSGRGFLSGKASTEPMIGYLVSAHEAVEILASKAPDAATWWRTFARPYITPGKAFMFEEHVCEQVEPTPPNQSTDPTP